MDFHRPFRTDSIGGHKPGTVCRANIRLSLPGRTNGAVSLNHWMGAGESRKAG
jgi:hypothetical protein